MTLRIEIQEQPERSRFFSEVEIGRVARRTMVATPATGNMMADLEAHIADIWAALYQMMPELRPADEPATYSTDRIGDDQHPGVASMPAAPVWVPDENRKDVRRGALEDGIPGDHTISPQQASEKTREHMGVDAGVVAEERTAEPGEGPAVTVQDAPEMNQVMPPGGDDLDALRADAEAAGVRVDKRWGRERLEREIASARTPA